MNKRSAAKKRAEWERAHDSEAFVLWTQGRMSVASGLRGCVCHHVHPDVGLPVGGGRKADACWIVPITKDEHRELHGINGGEKTFEAKWDINLADEAREHWAKWRKRCDDLIS